MGMANSPTMCQLFVGEALIPLRQLYPGVRCVHYMDDILIATKSEEILNRAYVDLVNLLEKKGLFIAPEKVQRDEVVNYLGAKIQSKSVFLQKVELRKDNLRTLNDFQKLLGDINWVRSYLNLPSYELKPLYNILIGDSALDSLRYLNKKAREALQKVEERLSSAFLKRWNENEAIVLCVLPTFYQPTGILWQNGPLLWIYPKVSPAKSIEHYPTAIASLANVGIQQCLIKVLCGIVGCVVRLMNGPSCNVGLKDY